MTLQAGPAAYTGARKRVLVVDDSFIMRNLVKEIVESDPDLEVVDTAENGMVALQKVRQIKPDVVLLDIEMPEMSGLETLRRLGCAPPARSSSCPRWSATRLRPSGSRRCVWVRLQRSQSRPEA